MSQIQSTPSPDAAALPPDASKRRVNYWWSLPLIAALISVALLSYKVIVPTAKDPESRLYSTSMGYPAQQRRNGERIEVETTQCRYERFEDHIAASGETVGLLDLEIRPQITGIVSEVLVEEGQLVKKGDVLLRLEAAPAREGLNRARAELAIAEAKSEFGLQLSQAKEAELRATIVKAKKLLQIAEGRLQRYTSLKDDNAASSEEHAAAEELYATRIWELAAAEQQLKQQQIQSEQESVTAQESLSIRRGTVAEAERNLKNTAVVAPSDALVTRLTTQPGELAGQNVVALTLADNVVFQAYIDQTGVDSVQPGDSAAVRLIAYPGRQFRGSVVRVNPSINTQGRLGERGQVDTRFTYSAWVKLEGGALPPGLQGHAEFHRQTTTAALPERAVIHLSAGEGMVMVVAGGRTEIRRVELGRTRGSLREIKSGLGPEDQVVLYPRGLEAGDLVSFGTADDRSPDRPQTLSQHQQVN